MHSHTKGYGRKGRGGGGNGAKDCMSRRRGSRFTPSKVGHWVIDKLKI